MTYYKLGSDDDENPVFGVLGNDQDDECFVFGPPTYLELEDLYDELEVRGF